MRYEHLKFKVVERKVWGMPQKCTAATISLLQTVNA